MLLVPGDGGFDAAGVVAVDGDGVVAKLLSISFEEIAQNKIIWTEAPEVPAELDAEASPEQRRNLQLLRLDLEELLVSTLSVPLVR